MRSSADSGPQCEFTWNVGQDLLNEYTIIGILGRGGMGVVYQVKSKTHERLYAVKTLLEKNIGKSEQKTSFMRELRTWIDLPDHPNLIPCYFFRTIGDRLAIFSEYAAGGSLRDWIQSNPVRSLDKILEIAIRSAWGLHAAHHCGVVHQDIKPANILMTSDGVPRISDFGLARALEAGGIFSETSDPTDSLLVSSHGMTTAYCSPEQAIGQKLDHRTDIWSWGLSVLEMFKGSLPCRVGVAAPYVLSRIADHPAPETGMAIPSSIVEILARCFQENPKDRWRSMAEIADELQRIYPELTERCWIVSRPVLSQSSITADGFPKLAISRILPWTDPLQLLEFALECAAMPAEFQKFQSEHFGSVRSKLLAYHELLDRTMDTLSDLPCTPDGKMEFLPVAIRYMQGYVMAALDDCMGAIDRFDTAREAILRHSRWSEEVQKQIQALYLLFQKALMLHKLNRFPESHQIFEEVNRKAQDIDPVDLKADVLSMMGTSCNLRGIMYFRTADLERAEKILDEAVVIFEEGLLFDSAFKYQLSLPLMTLAAIHGTRGNKTTAAELFDRVIDLRQQLVFELSKEEHHVDLALAYANKALVVPADQAEKLCWKAIDLMEEIVYKKYGTEHMAHLAGMNMMLSNAMHSQGKDTEALQRMDRACRDFDYLINWMGRTELLFNQAAAWVNRGNVLMGLDRLDESILMFDQAIHTWELMIREQNRKDLTGTVAVARINRARGLVKSGKRTEAVREAQAVMEILLPEIERTGRNDLRQALETAHEIVNNNDVSIVQ